MEDNMAGGGCRKKENFQRTYTLAEIRLEKRIKRVMSEIRGADGEPPSRAFRRVMYDEQKPAGMIGRRLTEVKQGNAPREMGRRILLELLDWYDNDLYGSEDRRTA